MRKLVVIGMAIAMLAVPTMASANAGSSTTINSSGLGSTQGNAKNYTTQYKVSYADPVMGDVACTGVHKSGSNYAATGTMDTWTCTSTTGLPLTGVTAGQVTDLGWNSDFFALPGKTQVDTTTAHITVSLDGMSATGTAYYPGT